MLFIVFSSFNRTYYSILFHLSSASPYEDSSSDLVLVSILDKLSPFICTPILDSSTINSHTSICFFLQDNVLTLILEGGLNFQGVSLYVCLDGFATPIFFTFIVPSCNPYFISPIVYKLF